MFFDISNHAFIRKSAVNNYSYNIDNITQSNGIINIPSSTLESSHPVGLGWRLLSDRSRVFNITVKGIRNKDPVAYKRKCTCLMLEMQEC